MFRTLILTLGAFILSACAVSPEQETPQTTAASQPEPKIDVMVIGSPHFASPGADVLNIKFPDVFTEKRQQELEQLTDQLMAFKPTLVAIERMYSAPKYQSAYYKKFSPEMFQEKRGEDVQLAFRLANKAGLNNVYGIDEQPEGEEPSYFPYGNFMQHLQNTNQEQEYQSYLKQIATSFRQYEKMIEDMTMGEILVTSNDYQQLASADIYFKMMSFDQGEEQWGAEIYGYYMMRNAKIYSKLMQLAKPGDRVVIVYGSGHKHWLEHLFESSPYTKLVDPIPYLKGEK